MSLRERAHADELMDDPALAPEIYARVLNDLAEVNRLILSARPTIGFLAQLLRDRKSFRLLDVGFGQGDMLRAIARWAAQRGKAAELVGIDLNLNSAPVARAATPPGLAIDYRTGDYATLAGKGFDVIISSLVAHHMTHDQLVTFLRFMEAEARLGWMINDLHRLRLAYIGFPILATAMRWHPIVRHDGQLSVARSFRREDWQPLLAETGLSDKARVVRRFPFRLCVERMR
ncbi:methyltransferase type 12 [Sphingomonas oleivorans]|uniref:Methyltransferase type 12 n=1 Tax=Sphingomonas oleivorans TaxID=1735121 RepID=A0A2T5G3A3_9SPHN|nr:methyltransferase type 12 [Sphingomonas oleivorans]